LARIEREKLERAKKHAERTAKSENTGDDNEKKAAIEAAMARAKEQKETITPQNVENVSANVAAEIASVDAARVQAAEKTE